MMVLVSRVAGMEKGVERTFGLYSAVCLFNVLLLFLLPALVISSCFRIKPWMPVTDLFNLFLISILLICHDNL